MRIETLEHDVQNEWISDFISTVNVLYGAEEFIRVYFSVFRTSSDITIVEVEQVVCGQPVRERLGMLCMECLARGESKPRTCVGCEEPFKLPP